jgi:hypothetical protein
MAVSSGVIVQPAFRGAILTVVAVILATHFTLLIADSAPGRNADLDAGEPG